MKSHKEIIQRLKLSLPSNAEMFIAGGYAADQLHGIKPKDCDVWVKCDIKSLIDKNYFNIQKDKSYDNINKINVRNTCEDDFDVTRPLTVKVLKYVDDIDVPIDLILLNDSNPHIQNNFILDVVENFDFSFCQAYIDNLESLDYEIKTTEEFDKTFKSKKVKEVKERWIDSKVFIYTYKENKKRESRLAKYSEKYKDFGYDIFKTPFVEKKN